MNRHIFPITIFALLTTLVFCNAVPAEIRTFTKEYTYQASEFDSKASSRTIALEQVKRLLLEELGTYLESHTEVKNFELTKDRITALSAGVVQTQVLDEKWDGKSYWLKSEIKVDPENVARSIDTLRKDRKKMEGLEEKIKKHDEALKDIEILRKQIAELKDDIRAKEKFEKSIETLKEERPSLNDISLIENQGTSDKKSPSAKETLRSSKTKGAISSTTTPSTSKYVASKKTKKYHYSSCKWADKIKSENMIVFKSARSARQAGYIACKVCNPPTID